MKSLLLRALLLAALYAGSGAALPSIHIVGVAAAMPSCGK